MQTRIQTIKSKLCSGCLKNDLERTKHHQSTHRKELVKIPTQSSSDSFPKININIQVFEAFGIAHEQYGSLLIGGNLFC